MVLGAHYKVLRKYMFQSLNSNRVYLLFERFMILGRNLRNESCSILHRKDSEWAPAVLRLPQTQDPKYVFQGFR